MANKIYTSSTGEDSLILDPMASYMLPFGEGDDWNHVRVGLFLSYTDSAVTDMITDHGASSYADSGGFNPITYSYFGACRAGAEHYIPDLDAITSSDTEKCFVGTRFTNCIGMHGTTARFNDNLIRIWRNSAVDNEVSDLTHNPGANYYKLAQHYYWREGQNNASHLAWEFEKGISGDGTKKTLKVTRYEPKSYIGTSDLSLLNLKVVTNGYEGELGSSQTKTFNWGTVEEDLPYPNAFFFYNAFTDHRPKFHGIAVKRFS